VLLVAALFGATAAVQAQVRRGGGRGGFGFTARTASPKDFDGRFHFCRIIFRNSPEGDGDGWSVDWPRADVNLSIRLSELTKLDVSKGATGEPNHLLIHLTDDELFDCPFVMMTEPGGAAFDDQEAAKLRLYLEKGGFLWVDDFWGEYAWGWWVGQLRKAMNASLGRHRVAQARGKLVPCARQRLSDARAFAFTRRARVGPPLRRQVRLACRT